MRMWFSQSPPLLLIDADHDICHGLLPQIRRGPETHGFTDDQPRARGSRGIILRPLTLRRAPDRLAWLAAPSSGRPR